MKEILRSRAWGSFQIGVPQLIRMKCPMHLVCHGSHWFWFVWYVRTVNVPVPVLYPGTQTTITFFAVDDVRAPLESDWYHSELYKLVANQNLSCFGESYELSWRRSTFGESIINYCDSTMPLMWKPCSLFHAIHLTYSEYQKTILRVRCLTLQKVPITNNNWITEARRIVFRNMLC